MSVEGADQQSQLSLQRRLMRHALGCVNMSSARRNRAVGGNPAATGRRLGRTLTRMSFGGATWCRSFRPIGAGMVRYMIGLPTLRANHTRWGHF